MGENIENKDIAVTGNFAGRDMYNYYGAKPTRLERLFQLLAQEVKDNKQIQNTLEDIKYYATKLDGTKGLEEKLKDGGYSLFEIESALRKKQKYAKKAEKYKFYESAQKIDTILLAEVKLNFETYVYPLIKDNCSLVEVRKTVLEKIIKPLYEKIEKEGASDENLCYSSEDIDGMIFYLTGGCHLNWTDYDIQSGV